jgi:cytochrome c oxidase subunit IV
MLAIHAYAEPGSKVFASIAVVFMALMAGITSCLHFVILTTGSAIEETSPELAPLLISFEWPSVVYALDILAWDWFFALSMLSAALVFNAGGLEKLLKLLMLISGMLSLAGLIGVPLADMQYRNIGIIGYGVLAPVAFLIMGIVFGRAQPPAARPDA